MSMSTAVAAQWVERWEGQQERYAIDREERFTVIADVVEHVSRDCPSPLVVDLGSGPGALAARIAARLPAAQVLAADADPLLLELGRAHYGTALRHVEVTIGAPGWLDALALDRPLDAAVSTTALHYLGAATLREVYRELAERLRPGGVFVNGDHIDSDSPAIHDVAREIGRRRSERCQALAREDWQSWWAGATADPALSALPGRAAERSHPRCEGNDLSVSGHVGLLREAGFGHAGAVWQFGNSHVLVAVR
ncbi:trans-aconitate 2-methyltransferase [Streptomyces sp. NBC_00091]|uniref:class I SAM-dependent methyltransferase n=1 Tax=Streptomyces sp. NBC_00091 TaxID=2975648 RepID=UPI002258616D|nr:class I SAM-dependent methyltransferase [Streptomyces sp. NBC_00091]MCX5381605.1 class I SAM-dependent methyltransferase [Streptomyces sp. NBC_00091]